MSDDELDRRLRVAGESWRAAHPLHEVPLPGRRPRPAWVAPLAAAASVALLAGGAAVAVEVMGGHEDGSAPAGTDQERWDPDLPPGLLPADVPGAVPPVNQVVRFPAAEAAGAYTPRVWESEGVRSCRAGDVRLRAAADAPGSVRMTLSTTGPQVRCTVGQLPFLQYEKGGRPAEVETAKADPRPGDWPASVVVTADRPAVLDTSWTGWCAPATTVDTVQLFFEDSSDLEVPAPAGASCDTVDFADDQMHYVGWEPEGFTFEPISSMPVEARLVDTVEGPRGLPTWVVELTARRDVELSTCPSWEVRQGAEESASWRLNCAAVPDHRADGTPYLPAGEPVRFAIWVPYGGSSAALSWVLTTVDGPVTVPLTEGPEAPTGEPRRLVERDANVHVYVSVGFDEATEVSLSVDGTQVLDEPFRSQGQDVPTAVELAVPAGRHTVVLESGTGARREVTLGVPARGDRWVNLELWDDPATAGEGRFEWRVQDSPPAFG